MYKKRYRLAKEKKHVERRFFETGLTQIGVSIQSLRVTSNLNYYT